MAGRKPKPSALRALEGNPGKRPLPKNEPAFSGKMPSCPKHIDQVGNKEWRRILKILLKARVVTAADMSIIAAYADSYSRWVEASIFVKKDGLVVSAPSGYPVQNPYLNIINKSLDQMKAFAVELGLTPSSRTRISALVAEVKEDPLDALLRNRNATKRSR